MPSPSMLTCVLLLAMLLLYGCPIVPAYASQPNLIWDKTFTRVGRQEGHAVVATGDGYVIGESTSVLSNGVYDAGLIKTDLLGNVVWEKAYGGAGNDVLSSVIGVKDGYVFVGYTGSFGKGGTDVYLVKTDLEGNLVWQKTYGGTGYDGGLAVVAVNDGYVIAGYTKSFGSGSVDVYLIKTDLGGNQAWEKTYGGASIDQATAVVAVNDGYVIAGFTMSFGNASQADLYLVKTDLGGNLAWQKTYGGIGSGNSMVAVSDGYIIVGNTFGSNVSMVKTDLDGDIAWIKTFGERGYFSGNNVIVVNDGYLITGSANPFENGSQDVYLLRTDLNGNLVWEGTYGGSGNDQGRSVIPVSDGYVIAGSTFINGSYHVYLAKVSNKVASSPTGIPTPGTAPTRENSVDGYVYDNGKPAAGAMVVLWENGEVVEIPDNPRSSGNDGHFLFEHLPPGNYTIIADKGERSGQAQIIISNGGNTQYHTSIGLGYASSTTPWPTLFDGNLRKNILRLSSIILAVFIGIAANVASASAWLNNLVSPIFKKIYDLISNFAQSFLGETLSEHTSAKEKKRPIRRKLAEVAIELIIISASAFFLGLAFFVADRGPLALDYVLLYIIVAGCAIVLHDLAHRIIAALYKKDAEYKFWWLGTVSMFLTAMFCGFVFCQPARTIIYRNDPGADDSESLGPATLKELKRKNRVDGVIFLSGPVVSLSISMIFLFMVPISHFIKVIFSLQPVDFHGLETYFSTLGVMGFTISLLTGVYSLMPFEPMDGSKVYKWKKLLWALFFFPSLIAYVIAMFLLP